MKKNLVPLAAGMLLALILVPSYNSYGKTHQLTKSRGIIMNTELLRGTIFGNLKTPKLGKVEITFTDHSVESREINSLGTTIFEGKGLKEPEKIKILGKEYLLANFPEKVDLGEGK